MIAAEVLALSEEDGDTKASRTRAVQQAVQEVAGYLGNTPTVARSSYIDPRVIERYQAGGTIADAAGRQFRSAKARQTALEQAALELLDG